MSELAREVEASVKQAADALEHAAACIPDCDCASLDVDRMAAVITDVMRAELAAEAVHRCFKALQQRHGNTLAGKATLETQPLAGLPSTPVPGKALDNSISALADLAGSETTGGQCC